MTELPHETIKRKAQTFRSNCLGRAKKFNLPTDNIPMPRDFAEWLTLQPLIIKRKRVYLTCYLTGELVALGKIEIDHREPISRGGSFQCLNLGITSARINQAKGNRTESEFKALLELLATFEDGGKSILADLRAGQSRRFVR